MRKHNYGKVEQTLFIDEFDFNLNASRMIKITDEDGMSLARTRTHIYIFLNNKNVHDYIIKNVKTEVIFGLTSQLKLKNSYNRTRKFYIRFPVKEDSLRIYIKEEEYQEWIDE